MKTRIIVLLLVAALCPAWGAQRVEAATTATPGSITVPVSDLDGAYKVGWTASTTAGATYYVQEAMNPQFSMGMRTLNAGTALSWSIAGRIAGKTYYYRVQARHAGYADSSWRMGENGCAVPGTGAVVRPPSLTVPAADADGAYLVKWTASVTPGVTYVLEEATNSTFTAGRRIAYFGLLRSRSITGRAIGKTYFYRVRAIKAGLKDSVWRLGTNGCVVPDPCAKTVLWGGYEWQKCGSKEGMNWSLASAYCENLIQGGHSDWRLPSMEELKTLIVCTNGTVVTGGYPDGSHPNRCDDGNPAPYDSPTIDPAFSCFPNIYWSSSLNPVEGCLPEYGCHCAEYGGCAFGVNFNEGETSTFFFVTAPMFVRCVRSVL